MSCHCQTLISSGSDRKAGRVRARPGGASGRVAAPDVTGPAPSQRAH